MFKEFIGKIKDKIVETNNNNKEFQKHLAQAEVIQGLMSFSQVNENNRVDPNDIVNNCPDLNVDKAKLIIKTIPIDEVNLCVIYSREIKTNMEYFFVPTTKYLWIINQYGYVKHNYENVTMQILKSGLMSKMVRINNHVLEMTGDKIEYLLNIISNPEYRIQELTQKNSHLCGIIPTLRIINNIGTGISLDNERNIVFHTKDLNKKYHISELDNYELYIDNNATIEKRTKMKTRITAGKSSCYEMKFKITAKTGESFFMQILPRSTFEKIYQSTNNEYINSFKFAREIIDILDELNDKQISGY